MAYRCSGNTNEELISNMQAEELIQSELVASVFKRVDRANYVLNKRDAYIDSPQSILANATISAPHMHASATENLLPFLRPGARVLDVGSGSGYSCAIFHHLVGNEGKVVGIDHMEELVNWSKENLGRDGLRQALSPDSGSSANISGYGGGEGGPASGADPSDPSIIMVTGDGRKGYTEFAPYDAIHVGAAAPEMPAELVDQLRAPGRMFIPVGKYSQQIIQVDKDEHGKVTQKKLMGVMYVPLTDAETQAGRRRY